VLQITEMLDLYRAELARVLQLKCEDVAQLASGRRELEPGTPAWDQAILFVRFYQALFEKMAGDGVAMHHWLRADNPRLNGVPLLLMVDDGRLAELLDHVEQDMEQRPY
jgi:hypothetical protein